LSDRSGTKISVVIPSYKSSQTIARCVESVLNTKFDPLEVIIVDDCSPDDTADYVEEHVVAGHEDRVAQLRLAQNGGPAKARNAGARIATGEWLFFLDSDTEMLPDALDQFARRMGDADAVVGIYDLEPLNSGVVPLYKAFVNYYFFHRLGVIEYEVFDSSRAGIKADVFREIGGFNESLGWGMDYENEEIGYRISERFRMNLAPSVRVKHMFPTFSELTRIYFLRVALWMNVFFRRRKFESGGVTSVGTGVASASILLFLAALLVGLGSTAIGQDQTSGAAFGSATFFFLVYIAGYQGLFRFIYGQNPGFLPVGIVLNIYFTLVIACGATFGLLRSLVGKGLDSKIEK